MKKGEGAGVKRNNNSVNKRVNVFRRKLLKKKKSNKFVVK